MTAEKYLRQYVKAVNTIRRCEREYEEERLQIDAIRSPSDNDGMPHGSGISRPTEDKVMKLLDKAEQIAQARIEAVRVRQQIFNTIMLLDGLEVDVLLERYIYLTADGRLKPWEQVCKAVNYSWHPVRLAWHRGLDHVQEIIDTR